jgi:hypothetical protein
MMRDKDIRRFLLPHIREQHRTAGTLVVEEYGGCWDTRPDVAVFERHSFHAYEIKSDHDTLNRLPRQMEGYASLFDQLTVCCGPVHFEKVAALAPDWVGLLLIESAGLGRGRLTQRRPARRNPGRRHPEFALHQTEAQRLLREHGLSGTSRMPQGLVQQHLRSLALPDAELLPYVLGCLTKRYAHKNKASQR